MEAAVQQVQQADGRRLEEGEHLDDEAAARLQGFQRAEHFTEVQVRDDTLLLRRLALNRSQVTEHFTEVQVRDDTLLLRRLTLLRSHVTGQIRGHRTLHRGAGPRRCPPAPPADPDQVTDQNSNNEGHRSRS